MINLITKIRPDFCLSCNTARNIELYDYKNNPVRYTALLDSNNTKNLINRKLSHFQCKKCKKVYMIDWSDKTCPKPAYGNGIKDFLRKFFKG